MPWPQAGATYAQLGLPDKGRAIKGLVVCWIWLVSMIYGMGLWTAQGA